MSQTDQNTKQASFRISREHDEQIKAFAWFKRLKIQEVYEEIISEYFNNHAEALAPIMELYRAKLREERRSNDGKTTK